MSQNSQNSKHKITDYDSVKDKITKIQNSE